MGRMLVFRKSYISLALAAGLLFLFLHKAEWRVMRSELKTAEWALLAAAVAIRFVCLLIASLRWQLLLLPVKRVALAPLFSAMMKTDDRWSAIPISLPPIRMAPMHTKQWRRQSTVWAVVSRSRWPTRQSYPSRPV